MNARGAAHLRTALAPLGVLLVAVAATSCARSIVKQYEYEEDLHLALDGSAAVYVNSSVPALVALRGADLEVRPTARLSRARVRELFESPAYRVTRVSTSRRLGRRFVHVRIDVDDVTRLGTSPMLAWSKYGFKRAGEQFIFSQEVGPPAGREVGGVNWSGAEIVAFRVHVPSRIEYHNATERQVRRGNILVWEQALSDRRAGAPIDVEVRMQTSSILATTLVLFGVSGLAACLVMAALIWWTVRKGGRARAGLQMGDGHPGGTAGGATTSATEPCAAGRADRPEPDERVGRVPRRSA